MKRPSQANLSSFFFVIIILSLKSVKVEVLELTNNWGFQKMHRRLSGAHRSHKLQQLIGILKTSRECIPCDSYKFFQHLAEVPCWQHSACTSCF